MPLLAHSPGNSILKHRAWLAAAMLLALTAAVIFTAGAAAAQGAPPTPPAPALPTGELGNPTGLQAVPGDYRGEVNLSWSPAANATINYIWRVQPNGSGGSGCLLPGLTLEGVLSTAWTRRCPTTSS